MKFCYVDETGLDGTDDAVILTGVIVDGHHLNKSLREWRSRLDDLLTSIKRTELKSSKFHRGGGGISKRMEGDDRAAWIRETFRWLESRRMKIALAAIDRRESSPFETYEELDSRWVAGAFHLCLQLQKAHGSLNGNKGTTVVVMDQAKSNTRLAELLLAAPEWSDDYYSRGRRDDALPQIIHTPFWVKSDHNTLVQLADLVAYAFRRYLELERHGGSYQGETEHVASWMRHLEPALLTASHRWPVRTSSDCAKMFTTWAPAELVGLGR